MNTPETATELGGTECLDAPRGFKKQSLQLPFGRETLSLLFDGKEG